MILILTSVFFENISLRHPGLTKFGTGRCGLYKSESNLHV